MILEVGADRPDGAVQPAVELSTADQDRLIAALLQTPGASRARVIETHISYVLLTGGIAYKIKKAVRLAFLDFGSLARRRFFCEQELRLNRRLAPSMYLDVVPITGTIEQPQIGGSGPILEYAVRMREFPQEALLSRLARQSALTGSRIDRLAQTVAEFHQTIVRAEPASGFGVPARILELALANFAEIRSLLPSQDQRSEIDRLEAWTLREHGVCLGVFAARHKGGFIRECHGDLHLGNVALVDDSPTIFDCIEFNDQMRWIDVIGEIAFTIMDLEYCGRPALARRFLNTYLEATGDYPGLAVLRFYLAYRAIVRAKIACLRAADLPPGSEADASWGDFRDHVKLAKTYAAASVPALIVMHGFAGCGKSTLALALLERIGGIRIRSDVERKRLHGLPANERSSSGVANGLYTPARTRATYEHVLALTRQVLLSGHAAIVDAAFLSRWQRDLFRDLARELAVRFTIIDVSATKATLRERLRLRNVDRADPSEADAEVLVHQLATHEALAADERGDVITWDGELPLDGAHATDTLAALIERIDSALAAAA